VFDEGIFLAGEALAVFRTLNNAAELVGEKFMVHHSLLTYARNARFRFLA
jgi:hypothetical protein